MKPYPKHDSLRNRNLSNAERLDPQRAEIQFMKDYLTYLDDRLSITSDKLTDEQLNLIANAVENALNAVENACFLGTSGFKPKPVRVVEWPSK